MPIKIIGDYRELLIDIFFAIVIAVGLDRFLRDFLIDHLMKLNSVDFSSIYALLSYTPSASHLQIPIIFDILFFSAAYFWVISHWMFYHELITKYPYYRWGKFFVDLSLFTIMFIIVNISFVVADTNGILLLFVWLLIVWYFLACLWHLSDRHLRPLGVYLTFHMWRLVTYIPLLILLYYPLSIDLEVHPWYQYTIMLGILFSMILWNVHRLKRFLTRDSRTYLCKYIDGYPEWNSSKTGQLELLRFPVKKDIGDKGNDIIEFKVDHSTNKMIIFPEHVIKVCTHRVSHELETGKPNTDTLVLEIKCRFYYSDGSEKVIKVLFDLNDQIINSVQKGIKELSDRNKYGSMP